MADSSKVLFSKQHDGHDRDNLWDDSEMIDAWNRQLLYAKSSLDKAVALDAAEAAQVPPSAAPLSQSKANNSTPSSTSSTSATTISRGDRKRGREGAAEAPVRLPLPPSIAADAALRSLIESWYQAGFWTGVAHANAQSKTPR